MNEITQNFCSILFTIHVMMIVISSSQIQAPTHAQHKSSGKMEFSKQHSISIRITKEYSTERTM